MRLASPFCDGFSQHEPGAEDLPVCLLYGLKHLVRVLIPGKTRTGSSRAAKATANTKVPAIAPTLPQCNASNTHWSLCEGANSTCRRGSENCIGQSVRFGGQRNTRDHAQPRPRNALRRPLRFIPQSSTA